MKTFLELFFPSGGGTAALVGAGGKTSLMARVADESAAAGSSLLLTTTTKLQRPCPVDVDRILGSGDPGDPRPLSGERVLWVGQTAANGRKWNSPELSDVEELAFSGPDFPLLIEADGAACRPLKAPGDREPVIPPSVDLTAAIVGLSAVGRPIDSESVHRLEPFLEMSGSNPGEPLGPEHLVRVLLHPRGNFKGTPLSARRFVVLNQADAENGERNAALVIDELKKSGVTGLTIVVASIRQIDAIWSIVEL